jgi:nicotinamide mononucleotide transporter
MTPTILEVIAVGFSMLSVWFTVRKSILMWPTGIVGVIAFFFLFRDAKLYSDMLLQVPFLILNIGGWLYWNGAARIEKPIVKIDEGILFAIVGAFVLSLGVGTSMAEHTNAALPYWDASILVFSVVAQTFLMLRVFEHWYLWIIVDIISIGVYISRGLYLTAFEYVIFLGLCIMGSITWRKELCSNKA